MNQEPIQPRLWADPRQMDKTERHGILLFQESFLKFRRNKKYVLWNTGICPIASKVEHVTLATPPLGSFIVLYVVLAMA